MEDRRSLTLSLPRGSPLTSKIVWRLDRVKSISSPVGTYGTERVNNITLPLVIARRKAAVLSLLEIFGKNPCDSGKGTWDKLFIESDFYNTTKQFILKSSNGSAANLQVLGNC